MPFPEYPKEIAEATWKTVTADEYAELEKELGVGGSLKIFKKVYDDIDEKVFKDLEKAIKEKDGAEMKSGYGLLDKEFPKIEKFQRLAGEYNKSCTTDGAKLAKKSETKKAGEWLVKSGKACVEFGKEMDKYGEGLMDKVTSAPVEQIVPFKRDLTEWDLATLLTRTLGVKLDKIKLPSSIPITITITGTVGKQMEKNVTLLQEFYDAAFDEGKKLGATLKSTLEKIDSSVMAGKLSTDAAQTQVDAACDKFKTDLEKEAPAAVTEVWSKYQKEHEEYRAYQIKAGIKMGASITGLAVGVATTATTGWTGVGTVAGILTILKSVASIGSQIYDLWKEAAQVGGEVDEVIKTLIKRYQDETKNKVGATELGAAALKELTGYQAASIPKAEDKLKLYNSKLEGVHVNAVDGGADLKKCLTEYDALKTKLRKMIASLDGAPKAKTAIGKLEKVILETEKTVDSLVKMISGRMETYKTGMESAKGYKEAIEVLNGQVAEWSKIAQKYAVPLLGLVGATDLKSAVEKSGEAAAKITAAALEAEDALETASDAKEIVGNIKDMVGMITAK